MKNTELRIGNIFLEKFSQTEIKVLELLSNERIVFEGDFKNDWQAEPIPLTKELLLKFDWNGYMPLHFNSNFEIDEQGRLYCNSDYKGVNVRYVHELQNLYFALTGAELTYKNEM